MSTREKQEELVKTLRHWQALENAAVAQTAKIMTETNHPLLRLVMETIQRDSNMHHHIQEMIIETMKGEYLALAPDDLAEVWESVERHIEIEKQTIEMAQKCLEALKGTSKTVVQQYLVSYLLVDEQKHDKLLADLTIIKKGMYKSA